MIITYNDVEYNYPSTLYDIKLFDFITWANLYGRDFTSKRQLIMKEGGPFLEAELYLLLIDEATRSFAHFTGIDYDEVVNNIDLGQIVSVYNASGLILANEQRDIEVLPTYEWNTATWEISAPNIGLDGDLTRDEFRAVKSLAEAVIKLAEGDWSQMKLIAAAYFRQPGEEFNLSYLDVEGERYTMMENLTMDIAAAIAVYMTASMEIFLQMLTDHYNSQLPDDAPPPPPEEPAEFPVPPGGEPA